ncbi:undecaprenyl-diphosphate phosphatase [Crenobacter cavernae]|uniref:Undecaprenyl-diphosphatase n=1 Tax=Crenobacter cavernae TaxID=2290923 RepID=A0A345Y3B6_9NEIS|nr:undecaprenyl-diphosphate phosphatase [Crenobacter cavernae]AXK38418.1 undecaprenyl-diphosphate phosphatase [Crenobacter cavernae]
MDLLHLFKALLLGFVEGLSEFLPISSTGHLILIGDWIAFASHEARVFEVVIQLGAVLAVCWLYRDKIRRLLTGLLNGGETERRFALCVLLAFLPAAVIGALSIGVIKSLLFNPSVVAAALIVGGLIILAVEGRRAVPQVHDTEQIGWRHALGVGVAQCFAMIPGTSRSGATIVGGMLSGLSRQTATEFSFFLAMPTMLGAASYDLYRHHHLLNANDVGAIAVGFVAAFISALLVVKAMVRFVARHSLRVFAWYRIALGTVIAAGIATASL